MIRFTWYRFIITSRISSGFTFCVILSWKIHSRNKMNCELMLNYDTPALRQTGSRNLTGQKTLPTIWGTYMKLMTKYQISAINSCWEKCDEKYLGRTDRGKQYTPPFGEQGYNKNIISKSKLWITMSVKRPHMLFIYYY